jgi:S1-C subfamily serine protease
VGESWTADEALLDKLPRGMAGLIVSNVIKNRPLARAGIKQLDIILTCDGKPTMRRYQLLEMIRKKGPESSFKLEIFPHGEHQRKTVNLVTDCLEDLWK